MQHAHSRVIGNAANATSTSSSIPTSYRTQTGRPDPADGFEKKSKATFYVLRPTWQWLLIALGIIVALLLLYSLFKMADPRNHKTIDVGQVAGIESTVSGPLSWSPRLFFYHKFFTPDECNHIIKLAESRTALSDSHPHAPHRDKCILLESIPEDDAVLRSVEGKMAFWSSQPKENGELLCVHKIEPGQSMDVSIDTSEQDPHNSAWGFRTITLSVFLNSLGSPVGGNGALVPGGLMHFPNAREGHLEIAPRQGDALLLWNITPDRSLDTNAKYGIKENTSKQPLWVLSSWYRQKAVK